MTDRNRWLNYIIKLQSIAQNGLTYGKDKFDLERYAELRDISAQMLAELANLPLEIVDKVFLNESGYQTPKLVTRTAIFKENKILLIQENNGKWALPGGWCEVNLSLKENAVKEVKEESGLECDIKKVIALIDGNKHRKEQLAHGICVVFLLADAIGGKFEPNIETLDCDYFALDNLPDIDIDKVAIEQIAMCFRAREDSWNVLID